MKETQSQLPRYETPPVIETVMGVFFRPQVKMTAALQGVLWQNFFRERFPNIQERAPAEEIQEPFGEHRLLPRIMRWQVTDRPDSPRLWATSESGEHVIQIQKNAFLTNWLKSTNATHRPYAERKSEYAAQLESLEQFFREESLDPLKPTSCVMTYVNEIEYPGLDQIGPTVAKTLTTWMNQTSDSWLPPPDQMVLQFAYPMPNDSGRLHVHVLPVVKKEENNQMLRLELTARSATKEIGLDEALSWMDIGHEWIVRGFTSITSPEMHRTWERIQ